MDIAKKLDYAKLYIDSIATHDDAPIEEVETALTELNNYAVEQFVNAQERRAAAEAAADPQAEASN